MDVICIITINLLNDISITKTGGLRESVNMLDDTKRGISVVSTSGCSPVNGLECGYATWYNNVKIYLVIKYQEVGVPLDMSWYK